ncbi:hypothetical protein V2H45_01810 [Tumidithrix elongata RA019]|uniref:Uncharacterized protein n=1 Tax=Tumidithrix elongata BACA0141 TaxID=2716417 RepID=A0AAW9PQ63_9CYAN|nr:hypothetical protein [Tumidithrix elongata RA019]
MNAALLLGALVVSVLLIWGLLSIIKTTFKTALFVALVVFGLQIATGIGPMQVFQQVGNFAGGALSGISEWLRNWGGNYKPPSDFNKGKQALEWVLQQALASLSSD